MKEEKKKMLQVDEKTHSLIKLQAVRKGMTILEYLKFLSEKIEMQYASK